MTELEILSNAASKFNFDGEVVSIERYGEGHINDTYKVVTTKNQYILQRVNDKLFTNVEGLMNNIIAVTEFMAKKITERGGDVSRETLNVIKTVDSKPIFRDKTGCYRAYLFIDNAVSYQRVEKPEHFATAASAFGQFAADMAEFDATVLFEPLPNFHNTEKRFNDFKNSLQLNRSNKADSVKAEIDFVLAREKYCSKVTALLKSGEIPTKVTHNDTKLNNVLIDRESGKALAVIDLDTVMPGTILYDFGDAIRFGCNPAFEDEKDLSKVNFRVDLFEEFAKNYLAALGNSVTALEKELLPFSAILMTYECGMRFLADHLDGDVYFKIHRPDHNLDRARTQFKLIADMEAKMPLLKKLCV